MIASLFLYNLLHPMASLAWLAWLAWLRLHGLHGFACMASLAWLAWLRLHGLQRYIYQPTNHIKSQMSSSSTAWLFCQVIAYYTMHILTDLSNHYLISTYTCFFCKLWCSTPVSLNILQHISRVCQTYYKMSFIFCQIKGSSNPSQIFFPNIK